MIWSRTTSDKAHIDRLYQEAAETARQNVRSFAHQHGLTADEEGEAQAMALAKLTEWRAAQYQAQGIEP